MESALLLARILLAGIFALAGVAKFLDLRGSEKAFVDHGVPRSLALPGAVALSVFEIAIAVLLLSTDTSWYASIAALGLLVLFISQMSFHLARGHTPDCHCFGQVHSAPVSKVSILRNVLFALPALGLVVSGPRAQGTALTDPRLDIMQLIFGSATVALLAVAVVSLRKILTQQQELAKRVELMELIARDGASVTREDVGHPHEGLPIGAVFPDFELPAADGGVSSLAGLRADGLPILFFFVSPSCGPCRGLVPEFEKWQRELAGRVRFVFVSSGYAEDNAEKFGPGKTILLQHDRELANLARAQWTPTAVLVDRNGRVASHAAAGDSAIRTLVEQIGREGVEREFTFFTNGYAHPYKIKIGEPVPDFRLADISGRAIDSRYFRGRKTLVTFWSLGCGYCDRMVDELRDWDLARGADDPALLVFSDGDKAENEKLGLRSPVILDEGHKTSAGLGMWGTPSAVLVNEDGVIISETAMGADDIWSLIGRRK